MEKETILSAEPKKNYSISFGIENGVNVLKNVLKIKTIVYPICDDAGHLICLPYSIENLHLIAAELNIKRCWFHKDHYDIPKRRIAEIKAKCYVTTPKNIVLIKKSFNVINTATAVANIFK